MATVADRYEPGSLQAQTILYNNPPAQLWRLMFGISAGVRRAEKLGLINSANFRMGDCFAHPRFGDADLADLRKNAGDFQAVDYHFFGENLGHSGGHNRLFEMAPSAEFFLAINPDTYPSPRLISELVAAMADPSVGIAEARQIPFEHPKVFDPGSGETSWASGCCLLIRRAALDAAGRFDECSFPLQCDDVDLSWRVRLAGYRVVHVPKAAVFHAKHLAPDATMVPGPHEHFQGILGRLLLAAKYGRPDVIDETIETVENHGNEQQRAATGEFKNRLERGEIPAAISEGGAVALFVKGEYAVHRF